MTLDREKQLRYLVSFDNVRDDAFYKSDVKDLLEEVDMLKAERLETLKAAEQELAERDDLIVQLCLDLAETKGAT